MHKTLKEFFTGYAREDGRVKYALTQKGLEALETLQEIVEALSPEKR